MLSQADRAICNRDPNLLGLPLVLDTEALCERVGIVGLRPVYVRYKPGVSCVVGLVSPGEGFSAYTAMTYPPDRYQQVRHRPKWQGGSDPVIYLDDAFTALVPVKYDRKLKVAERLVDPVGRASFLAKLDLPQTDLALLRYKSGRRIVARVDGPNGPLAILKSYSERDFKNALAGAHYGSTTGHAPLIGVSHQHRSIATGWVDGRPLCPDVSGVPEPSDMLRTGASLADCQKKTAGHNLSITHRWDADRLSEEVNAAVWLSPEHGDTLHQISQTIIQSLAQTRTQSTTLHGDFSDDQVVMNGAMPIIIDWDRIAQGDPARDLGTFLARLDTQVIDGHLTEHEAGDATDAFVEGYVRCAGETPESLTSQRARGLFALLTEGFRARRSDWPERMELILARIDRLISESTRRWHRKVATATPGLASALDAAEIGPKVSDALAEQNVVGTDLIVKLLRHKPGRRALIRYEFGSSDGSPKLVVLGKLRAKGADLRTPELHRSLREAGLHGTAHHCIGVPPILGAVETPALWLQPLLPGKTVSDQLEHSDCTASERAGQALALLHKSGVETGRTWLMADEIDVLMNALVKAANEMPLRAAQIGKISECVRRRAESLGEVVLTPIHRDFYPDQVLLGPKTTWILDLDCMAKGDPAIDVANYLAHLTEFGLRWHADPDRFNAQAIAFVAAYEANSALDRSRTEPLYWVSLARHILLSRRRKGRRHTTDSLIELCHLGLHGEATMFLSRPDV